ncbi:universal stress protein [Phytohabitans rumicis]|nr:universal stress protein [Phytohabitans rumicis]
MTEYENRPIMVGVDGSAGSLEAGRWAAAEARLHAFPVRVVCVYSWPAPQMPLAPLPSDWTEQSLRSAAEEVVAAAVDVVRAPAPDVGVTGSAIPGLAASKLVEASRGMGMVVVGHRGHGGLAAQRLGSVASKVAAHAHGPVTVVRPGTGDRPGREDTILVGVDGPPASDAALGYAFEEAERRGASVQALHSWQAPGPPWRTGMVRRTEHSREADGRCTGMTTA